RELEASAPVELLDGADQAEHALLDEVEQSQVVALVALGDGDDEAEVRVDHPVLRRRVAALDPLRELDLLRRGQERVARHLLEEELQRVGGRGGELAVSVPRARAPLAAALLADGDAAGVELVVEGGGVRLVEPELLDEAL